MYTWLKESWPFSELPQKIGACNLRHKNLGDVEFNIYRTFVTRDDGLAIGL